MNSKWHFHYFLTVTWILALRLKPTVVPEVFVVDAMDQLIYYGRINDQYAAPGKYNKTERSADLKMAIEAVSKGALMPYQHKKAVGCIFEAKAVKAEEAKL